MSDTRQVWKPWRANTRTAASRICWRFSARAVLKGSPPRGIQPRVLIATIGIRPLETSPLRPEISLGAPVGERGQAAAGLVLGGEVEVGDGDRLGVGRR